jgi:hypothetical protein
MRTKQTLVLTLVLTGTLQGCAGIGKQDFACPGHPSKPLCLSTSEVYRMTDGYGVPQARTRHSQEKGAPRQGDNLLLEIF